MIMIDQEIFVQVLWKTNYTMQKKLNELFRGITIANNINKELDKRLVKMKHKLRGIIDA